MHVSELHQTYNFGHNLFIIVFIYILEEVEDSCNAVDYIGCTTYSVAKQFYYHNQSAQYSNTTKTITTGNINQLLRPLLLWARRRQITQCYKSFSKTHKNSLCSFFIGLQYSISTMHHLYNTASLQYSITTIQHLYNTASIQYSISTIQHLYNTASLQYNISTIQHLYNTASLDITQCIFTLNYGMETIS